eukprot:14720142-Alexandrium_andersonii.AAC.1
MARCAAISSALLARAASKPGRSAATSCCCGPAIDPHCVKVHPNEVVARLALPETSEPGWAPNHSAEHEPDKNR